MLKLTDTVHALCRAAEAVTAAADTPERAAAARACEALIAEAREATRGVWECNRCGGFARGSLEEVRRLGWFVDEVQYCPTCTGAVRGALERVAAGAPLTNSSDLSAPPFEDLPGPTVTVGGVTLAGAAALAWVRETLRGLLRNATPGPWRHGHSPEGRDGLDYMAEAYRCAPPGRVHLVCVPSGDKSIDDEALFTAITGNGPRSAANALLIATACTWLPALLDALDAADVSRAEVDRLRRVEAALRPIADRVGEVEAKLEAAEAEIAEKREEIEELRRDEGATRP